MRERLAVIINMLDTEYGVDASTFNNFMAELPEDVAELVMGRVDYSESVYNANTLDFWLWEKDANELRAAFGLLGR